MRLADFGLAHLGKVPAKAKLSGTPSHLAPERIRGDEADERSDFYSFGCLLYEIFSGRPPLSARTPSELTASDRRCCASFADRRLPLSRALAQLVDLAV